MDDSAQDIMEKRAVGCAKMWAYQADLEPRFREMCREISRLINQKRRATDS